MSNDNNGGTAFPAKTNNRYYVGMTLRDYFATKAMQGMLTRPGSIDPKTDAVFAYQMADAMLKVRNGEL